MSSKDTRDELVSKNGKLNRRNILLAGSTLAAASAQLLNLVMRLVELATSDEFELRASARLFGNDLKNRLIVRIALLITGGIVLPLMHLPAAALLVAIAGELLGRYLFFVSVVPRNMAASFLRKEAA